MEDFELTPDPKLMHTLCRLIETLRGPAGCPWDRKQTPDSIVRYLTDEVYELADAVSDGDPDAVSEELGDVLFLTLFLAQLFIEKHHFGLDQVLEGVHAKMVRRHPHVFDRVKVENSAEVRRNWDRIKLTEKSRPYPASVVESIPHATPALARAYKMAEAIADAGFDRRSTTEYMRCMDAAVERFTRSTQETVNPGDRPSAFGHLLWSLVLFGRAIGIEPGSALTETLDRFEQDFRRLETEAGATDSGSEKITSSVQAKVEQLFE